mgnify:CR=1 FL=1
MDYFSRYVELVNLQKSTQSIDIVKVLTKPFLHAMEFLNNSGLTMDHSLTQQNLSNVLKNGA